MSHCFGMVPAEIRLIKGQWVLGNVVANLRCKDCSINFILLQVIDSKPEMPSYVSIEIDNQEMGKIRLGVGDEMYISLSTEIKYYNDVTVSSS